MKISKGSGTGNLHDDKYQALYIKLYANYANTECPVDGGRSGVAATDWAAGKYLTLPDYRGKVGGYYKVADANFGTLGKQIGAEIIDATKLPITSPYGIDVVTNLDDYYLLTNPGLNENHGETGSPNVPRDCQLTIIQTAIIKY